MVLNLLGASVGLLHFLKRRLSGQNQHWFLSVRACLKTFISPKSENYMDKRSGYGQCYNT